MAKNCRKLASGHGETREWTGGVEWLVCPDCHTAHDGLLNSRQLDTGSFSVASRI